MLIQTNAPKADRSVVPVEGPITSPAITSLANTSSANPGGAIASSRSPYGPNNEQLPERLQEALCRLELQFSSESESSRRQETRRIKQAHQFWRGLQYLWWDERDQNWHLPFAMGTMS